MGEAGGGNDSEKLFRKEGWHLTSGISPGKSSGVAGILPGGNSFIESHETPIARHVCARDAGATGAAVGRPVWIGFGNTPDGLAVGYRRKDALYG